MFSDSRSSMKDAVQPRTLRTRAKLLAAAERLAAQEGFSALRVEQVVKAAGVAKGTFFAHFEDKDGLLEVLIAARLDAALGKLEAGRRPESARALVRALGPLLGIMTGERYVLDLVFRTSGAAARDRVGPIALCFGRLDALLVGWFGGLFGAPPFRTDLSPQMLSEGVRAFAMQAMALEFCALHVGRGVEARLTGYVEAYLIAPGG